MENKVDALLDNEKPIYTKVNKLNYNGIGILLRCVYNPIKIEKVDRNQLFNINRTTPKYFDLVLN